MALAFILGLPCPETLLMRLWFRDILSVVFPESSCRFLLAFLKNWLILFFTVFLSGSAPFHPIALLPWILYHSKHWSGRWLPTWFPPPGHSGAGHPPSRIVALTKKVSSFAFEIDANCASLRRWIRHCADSLRWVARCPWCSQAPQTTWSGTSVVASVTFTSCTETTLIWLWLWDTLALKLPDWNSWESAAWVCKIH